MDTEEEAKSALKSIIGQKSSEMRHNLKKLQQTKYWGLANYKAKYEAGGIPTCQSNQRLKELV